MSKQKRNRIREMNSCLHFNKSSQFDLQRGQLVKSIAGRDKGNYYLVIGESDRYFLVADGALRRVENPKKKNPLHLQKSNKIAADLIACVGDRQFRNEEIREGLKLLRDGEKS